MCERIDLTPDYAPISGVIKEHLVRYVRSIGDVFNKDVLDVMCGTGYGMELMSNFTKSVTGFDYSDEAITATLARNFKCKHQAIKANIDEISSLSTDIEKYDVITSYESIEHLKDPERFLVLIKECSSPGTVFYLSTPNNEGRPNNNIYHLHEFTMEKIVEMTNRILKPQQSQWYSQDEWGFSQGKEKIYLFGRMVL